MEHPTTFMRLMAIQPRSTRFRPTAKQATQRTAQARVSGVKESRTNGVALDVMRSMHVRMY